MLEIKLEQVSERRKLYENTDLKIEPGINILIGNNGAGKTYCLSQIKNKYKHALLIDIVDETKKNTVEIQPDVDIGRWFCASEGQRVYDNLERLSGTVGAYITACKKKNVNPIVLIDGADSGVSTDLIQIIRSFLILVKDDCDTNKMEAYIICTANNYELVYDFNSIWITNLKRYKFKLSDRNSYYEFRELYLDNKN